MLTLAIILGSLLLAAFEFLATWPQADAIPYFELWTPVISNCIIWALVMQSRFGGYVVFRKSHYGWWPHAFWAHRLNCDKWYEYIPTQHDSDQQLPWYEQWKILLFFGKPTLVTRETL